MGLPELLIQPLSAVPAGQSPASADRCSPSWQHPVTMSSALSVPAGQVDQVMQRSDTVPSRRVTLPKSCRKATVHLFGFMPNTSADKLYIQRKSWQPQGWLAQLLGDIDLKVVWEQAKRHLSCWQARVMCQGKLWVYCGVD